MICAFASCNNRPKNNELETDETPIVTHYEYSIDFVSDTIQEPFITADIQDDKVMLQFNREAIVHSQYAIDEEYRLPDWPVEVEGLKGTPKSVFIGDIGQDTNPILCVLLDDGHVDILNLGDAILKGELTAGSLTLSDIVSFKSGGGGPWEEDGETYYSYTTIYATDTAGIDHEVMLYCLYEDLEHGEAMANGQAIYMLHLSSDWKISYVAGWYMSDIDQQYWGDFYEISGDYDTNTFVYEYHMTKRMTFGDEEPAEEDIDMSGSFRLNFNDEDAHFIITPLEGDLFGPESIDNPLKFVASSGFGG